MKDNIPDMTSVSNRGQIAADRAVSVIVAVLVASLLTAFLVPIAVEEMFAVDTSGWGEAAGTMWELLPLMAVLAVFLFFVQVAIRR